MTGLRTDAGTGWRFDAAAIFGTIRARPVLLIAGMVGFLLRGGVVLLTVPVLIVPTSVEVRLLLGNNLSSTGLTPAFLVTISALSVVSLAIAVLVLYALARCELAMFSRFVNSGQLPDAHPWPRPGRLSTGAHTAVVSQLFVVEGLALVTVLVAAIPLASSLGSATLHEIVSPSSSASIYTRIVGGVSAPLIGLVAALVAVEALSAVAARRVLARAFGLSPYARIERHLLTTLVAAVLGWGLLIGALAVSVPVLRLTWASVQSYFLSNGLSGGARELLTAAVLALLFSAVFAAVVAVCGLVSAVRSGLWTLASLR